MSGSAAAPSVVLETEDLRVDYGHVRALRGVSLKVRRGSLVTLIGANGAGKSTTLKAIIGLVRPSGGRVFFENRDITGRPTHKLVAQGLSLVPEGRHIFPDLTVRENLKLGALLIRDRREEERRLAEVMEMFPRLGERLNQKGGTLSGGEQQMLAIARALMQKPKVLLLDEPSLGLAPNLVQLIFEKLEELKRGGATILLVEQNAYQALRIADYAYVLETGRIALEGPAKALAEDRRVIEHYLGG